MHRVAIGKQQRHDSIGEPWRSWNGYGLAQAAALKKEGSDEDSLDPLGS